MLGFAQLGAGYVQLAILWQHCFLQGEELPAFLAEMLPENNHL